MMFGTNHDSLNGHGAGLGAPPPGRSVSRRKGYKPGLGYVAPNPNYGRPVPFGQPPEPSTLDIPLSCGVDPGGYPWVMFNNQYFSTMDALRSYFQSRPSLPEGQDVGFQMIQAAISVSDRLYDPMGTHPALIKTTLTDIVGQLRLSGVPFTAYLPPPAPVIQPVSVQTINETASLSAPSPADLLKSPYASLLALKDPLGRPISFSDTDFDVTTDGSYVLVIYTSASAAPYYFRWNGYSWESLTWNGSYLAANDNSRYSVAGHAPVSLAPPSTLAPSMPTAFDLPPGYMTAPVNLGFTYPIYGQVPVFSSDGTTSFSGATPFYGLVLPAYLRGGATASQYIGLDPTKLSAGLYAYKETDLGPITSPAGRTYELSMITFIDLMTQKLIGPFFQTTEGGGPGLLISNPLALASRIIVDISTMGSAEIVRAAAKAAGVSQANIDLATEAGAALAIAIATVGTGIVLSGGGGAAATAGAAFPTAIDAGSATATLILPTTAEVAAMGAAGSTLLPASLSLIAPLSLDAVAAAVTGASAGAAAPTVTTSLVPSAAIKTVTGAVTATAKTLATTALATEIKKLTGQLPGAKPPSQAAPSLTINAAGATGAPSGTSSAVTWGLGILALAAILKKKVS
jgi:hypothetical protein